MNAPARENLPESMAPPPRTAAASQTVMTQLVLPQHTNALGSAFGGQVLAWVDIAAGVCAMRHSGRVAVTASFDEVHFRLPIRHGDVVVLTARITWVGRTSMEVRVEAEREALDGSRELALEAFATFVAQDDAGRPTAVPALALLSDDDRRCYQEALQRRERRLIAAGRQHSA